MHKDIMRLNFCVSQYMQLVCALNSHYKYKHMRTCSSIINVSPQEEVFKHAGIGAQ